MNLTKFKVPYKKKIDLNDFPTDFSGGFKSKEAAEKRMHKNIEKMSDLQDKLYAHDKYALLIIFQAMDAAGKDGAIKHVMSGLNPQGCQVFSFKQPSAEELDHDYLWRINKSLPERGRIGIFNRSHYEEVLVVKVHDYIKHAKLPEPLVNKNIWDNRYRQIRDFERYLYENGVITVKFFLHVSKAEQKRRFLKRLEDPAKNWKFSASDLKERAHWAEYKAAYEECLLNTSTKSAPWYVIPADKKWFARLAISEIITQTLARLKPFYPNLNEEQLKHLAVYKEKLLNEK